MDNKNADKALLREIIEGLIDFNTHPSLWEFYLNAAANEGILERLKSQEPLERFDTITEFLLKSELSSVGPNPELKG